MVPPINTQSGRSRAPRSVRQAPGGGEHIDCRREKVAALLRRQARKALTLRIGLEHRLEPWLEGGSRLFRGHARLEASEHMHPHSAPIEQAVPARLERGRLLGHHGRDPQRRNGEEIDAAEARRRDPDHRHRIVVDKNVAPDHVRVAAEIVLPVAVREHHHRMGARLKIVRRIDQPAQFRAHAEHRQSTNPTRCRHERDRAAAPPRRSRVVGWRQKTPSKNCVLFLEVAAQGIGHQIAATPRGRRAELPTQSRCTRRSGSFTGSGRSRT